MPRSFALIPLLILGSAACSRSAPTPAPATPAAAKAEACPACPVCAADLPSAATAVGGDVLAMVNGVPITRSDVRASLRDRARSPAQLTADQEQAALEQLVQRELAAQQALRLGLQTDPSVVLDLAEIDAKRSQQRRDRLADLYFRRQVLDQTRPTDAEVQAHWDREQKQIRTEYHVMQLFGRDEAALQTALAAVRRGESIGAAYVKLTGAPGLGDARPWDLGYLKYQQTPPQWREILPRLKPGEISDVIRGPNHRFWLIQVVDVRANDALQLADVRSMIEEELSSAKRAKVREQVESELNKGAKVERATPSAPPPPERPVEP